MKNQASYRLIGIFTIFVFLGMACPSSVLAKQPLSEKAKIKSMSTENKDTLISVFQMLGYCSEAYKKTNDNEIANIYKICGDAINMAMSDEVANMLPNGLLKGNLRSGAIAMNDAISLRADAAQVQKLDDRSLGIIIGRFNLSEDTRYNWPTIVFGYATAQLNAAANMAAASGLKCGPRNGC